MQRNDLEGIVNIKGSVSKYEVSDCRKSEAFLRYNISPDEFKNIEKIDCTRDEITFKVCKKEGK
jgi:hypothetical protein